jgi:voltage-gated potassium channel Kch
MEETSLTNLKAERETIKWQFRALAAVSLAMFIGGTTFFHIVEHLSWINAFYFCTVTLTTVGYGDIVPKTDVEKLFVMGYMLVGIGVIATFANVLVKNAVVRRQLHTSVKKKGTPKNVP